MKKKDDKINKKIYKIYNNYYNNDLKSFFKENFLLMIIILIIPIIIFIAIIIYAAINSREKFDLSLIIGSVSYYGPIILSIYLFYKTWFNQKNLNNKKLNIKIGIKDFRKKHETLIYEIELWDLIHKYRCAYGLQKEPMHKLEHLKIYGYEIYIKNYSYELITNINLSKVYCFNDFENYIKIDRFWGNITKCNTILKYRNEINDFIIVDKALNIQEDDKSKIMLIYCIELQNGKKNLLFYELTFCKIGMKERSLILDYNIYLKMKNKIKNENLEIYIFNKLSNWNY